MGRHMAYRNWGGKTAGAAAVTALALTGGFFVWDTPANAATSCADALTSYNNAQTTADNYRTGELAAAKKADDVAQDTRDAAISHAQETYTTWAAAHTNATDAQVKAQLAVRDAAVAKANQDYAAGKTADKLTAAEKQYDTYAAAAQAAHLAADAACQGQPGPTGVPGLPGTPGTPGAPGANGSDGKDGIDARIVLSPGVCARAVVKPDPDRLVRVVVLIPCPPVVPPAPPAAPAVGDQVVVIPATPAAPAPQIQQDTHLPVTH